MLSAREHEDIARAPRDLPVVPLSHSRALEHDIDLAARRKPHLHALSGADPHVSGEDEGQRGRKVELHETGEVEQDHARGRIRSEGPAVFLEEEAKARAEAA